jgi:hypothetical protein
MNIPLARSLPIVFAALGFDAAANEVLTLEWSADNSYVRELSVPAGKFVEACGKLPAQAAVQWRFEAGGPLDFNVHCHEGKKVLYPARQNQVARLSGTLNAQVEQDYCWMWTNKAAAATPLRLHLVRR